MKKLEPLEDPSPLGSCLPAGILGLFHYEGVGVISLGGDWQ